MLNKKRKKSKRSRKANSLAAWRAYRKMFAGINDRKSKRSGSAIPAPLRPIRSEYDELCDGLGGPADISAKMGFREDDVPLPMYCTEYPSRWILPVFLRFKPDEPLARRFWPWAAFAISQYVWEQEERKKYSDEPAPKEIKSLISEIGKSAKTLRSRLQRLHGLSYRLRDPSAPLRRAHLVWLDAFVSQAVAGIPSSSVNKSDKHLLFLHSAMMDFFNRLASVEATTKKACKRVDRKLLERERGQTTSALSNFVFRCGVIWKSFTARKPSANKVDGREPDFVIFVQELAKIGGAHQPTRRQVEMTFLNLHPPIRVPVF
jgi:hypothetical protein